MTIEPLKDDDFHVQTFKLSVSSFLHDSNAALGLYAFGRLQPEDLIEQIMKRGRELKAQFEFYKKHSPGFAAWADSEDVQLWLGGLSMLLQSTTETKGEIARRLGQEA